MVGDGARRNMGEGDSTWWVSEIMAKRSLSVKQSLLGSLQLQGVDDRGARAEAERPGGRVLLITQVRKKRQGNSESSGLGNRKKGDSTD